MSDATIEGLIEEFLNRRQDGSTQSAEQFVEAHPEHREVLARRLGQLERLALVAAGSAPKFDVAQRFDGFEIVRELGRGGMGVVFEARQVQLGRSVAIKVIAGAGLRSGRLEARFEREIAALARISHPNIVKVFGSGTVGGAAYVVMELVAGDTLQSRVGGGDAPQTLAQFEELARIGIDLARALDHAHEQGVIHRDVKPGNVLIDPHGRPVLLDFGLARDERREQVTHSGEFVGTLAYTAPEQARGERVDRRVDVYGLGATLYHLATGATPYAARTLTDLVRKLESGPPASASRINRKLPPDLALVLDRAVAADPKQRYASCADLADDLQRFQRGDPVSAASPGLWSDVRALRRRHKVLFASAFTATVALSVGAATTLWQARRVQQQKEITATLFDGMKGLRSLVSAADSTRTEREVLKSALPALEKSARAMEDTSGEQASKLAAIGQASLELGDLDGAERAIRDSLEQREALLGREHPQTQESVALLALVLHHRGQFEEAEQLYREACTLLPLDDDESVHNVLVYRHNWAFCLLELGREKEALELLRGVIDEQRQRFGERDEDLLTSENTLARWQLDNGQLDAALETLERVVALRDEVSGRTHPDTLVARSNLAVSLTNKGRHAEAAGILFEVVEARRELFGADDPSTLLSMLNLGALHSLAGDHAAAAEWLRKAFDGFESALGPLHEDTLLALSNLMQCLIKLERWAELEPLVDELERRARDLGEGEDGRFSRLVASVRKALAERK